MAKEPADKESVLAESARGSGKGQVDLHALIKGMREEITMLRGELDASRLPNPEALDRQRFVDGVLERQEKLRRGAGRNEWWLYDRRKEKKPPVKFFSDAKDPATALRDYESRTGLRFVGQGSNPFYCKPAEATENV